MFSKLYVRLSLVLLAIFCLLGGVFIVAGTYAAHMYQQEVSQRLNKDLARYVVEERLLDAQGNLDTGSMREVFNTLMVMNPSVELYLLDQHGAIVNYSAPADTIIRAKVDTTPISELLSARTGLPILGDDPKSAHGKAFSAAAITQHGKLKGYLYAVLGSAQLDSIKQMLNSSYILRLSAWVVVAAVVFATLSGLLVFAFMTRRLRKLNNTMQAFRASDFSEPPIQKMGLLKNNDEIDSVVETFFDMSNRIQSLLGELRNADSLRRELVANISHDLRTPLTSLQGYLETLSLKDQNLSQKQRQEYLFTAMRHGEWLKSLVNELFELARLDAKETEPTLESFSLTELVHDVLQKFQLRAQEKQVSLHADCSSLLFASADIGMIERVLDNLIDNALQHTPTGGEICLALKQHDHRVSIEITDTGSGIESKELPLIFERFYRRPSSQQDKQSGGAGLGLAIAQRIVELHGSSLKVKSIPQQGTSFDFELSLA